ncbi:s phase cyclin A-associated protein in the endoplasmic reticulum [Caerostris extrusa]|uniref:S phase cyclin A-associated protein in the endoplasmic reticulum n=1 Tax=Caerostris extrusa TaxID=172846 RepID=A0AAV4Y1V8_CAEEX|nr:s phase cyclin A-associated protein in the endoplasmic reticulum [Caerostris extrusa]
MATKHIAAKQMHSTQKGDIKLSTSTDEKKVMKTNRSESAIKRNISYVQSLSSRNQSGRLEERPKKTHSRLLSDGHNVEKIPEVLKSTTDDDSDGWEMVRGRNRCRNSPAKKLPFMNKNHENQVAQIAKLNQSRIGGFPYTTKVNGKVVNKNSQKSSDSSKKTSSQELKNEKIACSKLAKNEINKTEIKSTLLNSTTNKELISTDNLNKDNASKTKKELPESKLRSSSERTSRKESLRLPLDVISILENDKGLTEILKRNMTVRSSSAPDVYSPSESSNYGLSKALCISDQYLGNPRYVNIKSFKKKLLEKGAGANKRRSRKTLVCNDSSRERCAINGSLDESDNGLTSDDQDGPMSHDEAFDVQCQELYDTAWK